VERPEGSGPLAERPGPPNERRGFTFGRVALLPTAAAAHAALSRPVIRQLDVGVGETLRVRAIDPQAGSTAEPWIWPRRISAHAAHVGAPRAQTPAERATRWLATAVRVHAEAHSASPFSSLPPLLLPRIPLTQAPRS